MPVPRPEAAIHECAADGAFGATAVHGSRGEWCIEGRSREGERGKGSLEDLDSVGLTDPLCISHSLEGWRIPWSTFAIHITTAFGIERTAAAATVAGGHRHDENGDI